MNFKNLIPIPVFDIISSEAPKYNHPNANITEWLNSHNIETLRNAISFKGPLSYFNYVPQFLESTSFKHPCVARIIYLKNAQRLLYETFNVIKRVGGLKHSLVQCSGSASNRKGKHTKSFLHRTV